MANQEALSFPGGAQDTLNLLNVTPALSTNYSGQLNVTYGPPSAVTGTITVQPVGNIPLLTFSNFVLTQPTPNNYVLTATDPVVPGVETDTFTISYTGTAPTSVNAELDSTTLGATVAVASGTGGVVNSNPVCFASGTLIRTVRGDVAVEALNVGDVVVTASGAERPIRWLGHREIDCRNHPDPRAVWPIRIAAHAFGDNLPSADLFLSGGHSVAVTVMNEVLVPIERLVNGATVLRHPVDRITYWHVELESHDVLVANNLPAESFLDCGNRAGLLENEGLFDAAHGPHTPADFCRPYVDAGVVVEAVRERLAAQAETRGWTMTHDMDMHLLVDGVRVDPDRDGGVARFLVPASAKKVVLASQTYTPSDFAPVHDHRRIGVSINRIEIDDGLAVGRTVDMGDPLLGGLFHPEEAAASAFHRLTDGSLALPPALWDGCRSHVFLRIRHDPAGGRRWLPPESAASPNIVPLRAAS